MNVGKKKMQRMTEIVRELTIIKEIIEVTNQQGQAWARRVKVTMVQIAITDATKESKEFNTVKNKGK